MDSHKIYDVCVVGAGMIGSSAAWHLTRLSSHINVILIGPAEPQDRSTTTIFASHYDEGRITRVSDTDPVLSLLAKRSIERYPLIESLTGIKFFEKTGVLSVISNEKQKKQLHQFLTAMERAGTTPCLLKSKQIEEDFPYLSFPVDSSAILDNMGGHISPRKLVSAHQMAASLAGCQIIHDVVSKVVSFDGYITIETEQKRSISAKKVLIATGGFTPFRHLLPYGFKLDLKMKTSTILKFELNDKEVERLSSMPVVIPYVFSASHQTAKHRSYILPPIKYPNGKWYLKLGLGNGPVQEFTLDNEDDITRWYQGTGSAFIAHQLYDAMLNIMPGLKYENLESDSCMTTHTKSGKCCIDMVTRNLGIAVGGNGHAAKMSDELGHIAARMILKGTWDYDVQGQQFQAAYKIQAKM